MRQTRFCPFCGEPEHPGGRFCPKCGNQYPFDERTDEDEQETSIIDLPEPEPPRRPGRASMSWLRAFLFALAILIGVVGLGYALLRLGLPYLEARRPEPDLGLAPVASPSPPKPAGSAVVIGSPSPSPVLIAPSPVVPSRGQVRVINTDGQGANMRQAPSTNAPIVTSVPDGTTLDLIGDDQQAEGRVWRNVREPGGTTGWIAAELLAPL